MNQDLCRLLFEKTNAALALIANNQFVYVTPGTAALLNCLPEQLAGQPVLDFLPATQPDGYSSAQLLAEKFDAAALGQPQKFEAVCQPANSQHFYTEFMLEALSFEGQTYFQLGLHDISRYKAQPLHNAAGQVIDAIESGRDISTRKKLAHQIQESFERRGRQLQLTGYLAQESASLQDLNDLYQRLITRIKELLGYYHVQLFHYNAEEQRLNLTAGYGAIGWQMKAANYQVAVGEGIVGMAAACTASVFSPDVQVDPLWQPYPLLAETRGEMAIPITVGGEYAPAQVLALETFLKHNYDGLIVSAIDLAAVGQVTRQALSLGKPVVAFGTDLGAENQSLLAEYSDYEMGYLLGLQAGAWANEHIPAGATLNLAMLTLSKLRVYLLPREEGMLAGLKEIFGDRFAVVASVTAGTRVQGRRATEAWLKEFPQLQMILAVNDAGALGAYEVVASTQQYSPDAFFIGGIDAIPEALTAIQAGSLYQATVTNSPVEMGTLLVRAAARAVKQVPVEQVPAPHHAPINSANIHEFLDEHGRLIEPQLPQDDALSNLEFAGVRLGLSVLNMDNPFFRALALAARTEAQRLNIQLTVSDPKKILGIIDVHSSTANTLTEEDRLVLEGLTSQLAVAIENTRLLAEANVFRQFAETAGQGLGIATLDGLAVYANPTLLRMLGEKNSADVMGKAMLNYYPQENWPYIRNVAIKTAHSQGQWLGELELETVTGKKIPTIQNIFLIRNDAGIPQYLANAITDISEQKRAAAELQARLDELATLQRLMSREGWASYQKSSAVLGYTFADEAVLPLSETTSLLQSSSSAGNGHTLVKPVTLHGEVIGSLGISQQPDQSLAAEDEAFLDSIAEQVAEALERARLLEQTHKRAVELETVARVGAIVSSVHNVNELLQTVVDLTKSRFGLYHVHIYLLNQAGDTLNLAAGAGHIGQQMVQRGWQIPLAHPDSVVARSARMRQGVINNDVRQSPAFLPNPLLPDTLSELAVPLLSGDEVLGVLDVQADVVNRFTDEDSYIQTTLASQVAVALQNTSLYQETQTALAEIERSQALLQTIINTSADWILVKDRQLRFQLVNQSFAATFNRTPEEFIGNTEAEMGTLAELFKDAPAETGVFFEADDLDVMATGQSKIVDIECSLVNDQEVFFNVIKTPLVNASGQVSGVLTFVHDVTSREKLLKDTATQAQRLARLNELSTTLNQTNSVDDILKTTGSQIIQIVGGDRASLALLTSEADQFELFVLSESEGSVPTGARLPVAGTAVSLALNTRQVKIWAGDEGNQYADIRQIRGSGPASIMTAPLVSGDKTIGMLHVGSVRPNFYSTNDANMLQQVASTLAANLDNRRLLQETKLSLQETEVLYRISRNLAQLTDQRAMFEYVLTEYLPYLQLPQGGALIFDENAVYGTLMALVVNGQPGVFGQRIPVVGNPPCQRVIATRQPVAINDALVDPILDPVRNLATDFGYKSMLLVPIIVRGRVIGALGADSVEQLHYFTEREIALVQAVADQLGSALDRRQLLAETQAALEEVERTQQRYTVQAWEAYQARGSAQTYEQLREGITPVDRDLPAGIDQVVANRKPVILATPSQLATGEIKTGAGSPAEAQTNLLVPLKVRNEVIGLLGVQDLATSRQWTPDEVSLVEAIAEQMSLAAESLRLLDETQQRAAREKRVNEIGEKIQAAQSLEEALKIAIKEVGVSLQAVETSVKLEVD